MAATLVIVDSPIKLSILQRFAENEHDSYQWMQFKYRSEEWLKETYWQHSPAALLAADDGLPALMSAVQNSQRVYFVTNPDAAGESMTALLAQACGDMDGKAHIWNAPILSKQQFQSKKLRALSNRQLSLFETAFAVDRRIDAVVREMHHEHRKLPVFGAASVLALQYVVDHSAQTNTTESPGLMVAFKGKSSQLRTHLTSIKGHPPLIPDEPTLKAIVLHLKEKEFHIEKSGNDEIRMNAPLMLNLGDLLAAARRHLGFPPSRTLSLALSLYEGVDIAQKNPVGLITFPITDSRWIPEDELLKLREYIYLQYGREYLPAKARVCDDSPSNEFGAIRPISLQRTPRRMKKHLSAETSLLYSLIWDSFIKSQMTDVIIRSKKLVISDSSPACYQFCCEHSVIEHRGFRSVSEPANHKSFSAAGEEWRVGQKLTLAEIELEAIADTKPSLTEADVIEYLSRNQVCFPEQLALIPDILRQWNLIEEHHGCLAATEQGKALARLLQAVHPELLNQKIIQKIVKRIGEGGDRNMADKLLVDLDKVIGQPVISAVNSVDSAQASGRPCPICGNRLSIKRAPSGNYVVCDGYPSQCRYSRRVEEVAQRFYGYCSECSHELVAKIGRYGRFLACSAFPKCTFTKPFPTGIKCPREGCSGDIVERVPKNGQLFYGCDQYPHCRFSSRLRPVNSACPQCGNLYMVVDDSTPGTEKWICPKCKYERNEHPKVGFV